MNQVIVFATAHSIGFKRMLIGLDCNCLGMLPPFAIQSEEIRAMAKHCTVGIEPRVSSERIILLDSQVFNSLVSNNQFLVFYSFLFIFLYSLEGTQKIL